MKRPQSWNWQVLGRFAFLALTVWVADFSHFRSLGLYEDDYAFISPAIKWQLPDLVNHAASVFSGWPQGRPIGFFLPQFFSFIGSGLGGLHVIYLIAFFVVTLNVFLFYALLRKVCQETVAFIGALAFCLFPADTTHTFLMHALGLQTSITFLLIASHLYLSGKRAWSYIMALCALLTYESPFMIFWAIPLIKTDTRWDRVLGKELIRHLAIMTGIVLFVVVVRVYLGEGRVAEMGSSVSHFANITVKIAKSIFIGPATSLALFFEGPARTLFHLNWRLSIVFIAFLGMLFWVLGHLTIEAIDEKRDYRLIFQSRILASNVNVQIPSSYTRIAKLFLVGLIMLGLAYTFAFTHFPPTARYGRMTSVHLAAAFGGSLVFACVSSILLSAATAYRLRNLAMIVLALYFSLVVAYRYSIQLDFIKAWENERSFWTGAIHDLPDMRDGTIIFVLSHDLPKTRYIRTNSWADSIMLSQIFKFPSSWENPPRLFVIQGDWTKHLVREGDRFKWQVPAATSPSHWEDVPNSNVILLEMENGTLVRKFGHININGQDLELKPLPGNVGSGLEEGPLYDYLIDARSPGSSQ